jgi:hypothetical protein
MLNGPRRNLGEITLALNAALRSSDVASLKSVYCIIADEEPRQGLAGCFVVEAADKTNQWLAMIPSSLFVFLIALNVLFDNHYPLHSGYERQLVRYKAYWMNHHEDDKFIATPLDENDVPPDTPEYRAYWTNLILTARSTYNAVVSKKASPEERAFCVDRLYNEATAFLSDLRLHRAFIVPGLALEFIAFHEIHHALGQHDAVTKSHVPSQLTPKAWTWCAELSSDEYAIRSLLARYEKEEAPWLQAALAWAVCETMMAVALQTKIDEKEGWESWYPPVSYRLRRLREIFVGGDSAREELWDVVAIEMMDRLISLGDLINWPALKAVGEAGLFIDEDWRNHAVYYDSQRYRFDQLCAQNGGIQHRWAKP